MNKQKMVLAVIGGVFGIGLLVMGYLVFSAYSAKVTALEGDDEEGVQGLETVVANAEQLSRKPVYPCQASVLAVESNATAVAEWREAALRQASKGDRFFEKTTAAAFKTMIVADAKRLSMLPGAAGGRLMKPEFTFGPFHDYIGGGKMPEEAQLATLQRQWDDLATLVEMLSKCGVAEITSIGLATAETKPEPAPAAKGKNARRPQPKKPAAKGKNAGKAEDLSAPNVQSYVLAFSAKPASMVQVINGFATSERFIVVEDFGFTRPQDAVVLALGGEAKKDNKEAQAGSRRSRRRGARVEEEKPAAKDEDEGGKKSGVVTDPTLDKPLAVTMRLSVCDFRSLEENAETKEEEVKK